MKPAGHEPGMILVTGGTGYIGSHTAVELMAAGRDVFIIDNLCNSKASVIDRVEKISGRRPGYAQIDVRDRAALQQLFAAHRFDAIIHFAGLKAVGESVKKPLTYYDNNVTGSVVLLECMLDAGVKTIIFSSSATVYGQPHTTQFREDFPLAPYNPYGRTKMMVEEMLRDAAATDPALRVALLRYFNPAGAHASGFIGEDPNDTPNNLMPYIAQVAVGKRTELPVYGNDYATRDGTGVRDYIHVVDLARGHLAALCALDNHPSVMTVNLGNGRGYSVLEMIRAFEAASGKAVPYRVVARRAGEISEYYADPALAVAVLGWKAELGIDAMCTDSWRWQQWAFKNL